MPNIARQIAKEIGVSRDDWPPSLLRRIWEALMEVEPGRRRSADHEARWLSLLGFALRPGYGLALDDWRVAETWKALQGKLVHGTPMCRAEWWILWRRIAGGLQPGWQEALATPLLPEIRQLHRQMTSGRGKGGTLGASSHESAEIWRLLGGLELLATRTKIELGQMVVDLLGRPKMEPLRPAMQWALGRIGSRVPMYGPLNMVVPADQATRWASALLDAGPADSSAHVALMQLCRRTDDRFRDVPDDLRDRAAQRLQQAGAPAHYAQLVREAGALEAEEQTLVFGESLPKGLRVG